MDFTHGRQQCQSDDGRSRSSNMMLAFIAISLAASATTAVASNCPSQCKLAKNDLNKTECLCSSGNSSFVLDCNEARDMCFVKCSKPLLSGTFDWHINLDLANVTTLDLQCSSEGSYIALLGGLGAERVQRLRLQASPSGLALTERAFADFELSPLRHTLKTLVLTGKLFKKIGSSNALSPLGTIDKLVVENTGLVYLQSGVFRGLSNLSTLEIVHNEHLERMERDVFVGLQKLRNLVLDDNERLHDLPSEVMYPLENLRTVNFTDFEIQNFSSDFFSRNMQLESIFIIGDNCPRSCVRDFTDGFLPNTSTLHTFAYAPRYSSRVESVFFSPSFFASADNVSVVDLEGVDADLTIVSPLKNIDTLKLLTDEVLPLDCELIPRSLKRLTLDVECGCREISCLRRLIGDSFSLISLDIQVNCNGTFFNATEAMSNFCIVEESPETARSLIMTTSLLLLSVAALAVGVLVRYRRLHPEISGDGSAGHDYDVFVSCVDSDADYAERLIAGLEGAHHVKCCYHKRDFSAGFPIQTNIEEKMTQSHRIILVVSSAFLSSDWCEKEMLEAKTQNKAVLVIARLDLLNDKLLQSRQHIYGHIREVTYLQEDHVSFEEQLLEFLRPIALP